MQLGPSIAPKVGHLTIFQRSPHWARKNPLLYAEVSDGLKWGLEHVPFYTKWWRFQLLYATSDGMLPHLRKDPNWPEPETSLNAFNKEIREQLIEHMRSELNGDEELLAKVTPKFPPYGKRMLRDSNWFNALTRDNVELVTGPVQKITATGVVDKDGVEHPADVIILATGFKAQAPLFPMEIVGTNGSLRDQWGDDNPRAHLGITVPDFPNLFILYGPGTNGGHGGSAVFNSECQVRYTMLALRELIEREATSLEVRREPFDAYQAEFDAEHEQLVWTHPGVNNWYRNKSGRVVTNNPWRLSRYRNMTAVFDPEEYEIRTEKVDAHEPRRPAHAPLDRGHRRVGRSRRGSAACRSTCCCARASSGSIRSIPKNETVQGLTAYTDIESVPEVVDLAIVALSAEATLPMLERCHALGIPAAMVYASGYAETNEAEGMARQEALIAFAQRTGMKIAGPNCMGNANFTDAIFTTFGQSFQPGEPAGNTALLTQSGNMCATVFRMARRAGVTLQPRHQHRQRGRGRFQRLSRLPGRRSRRPHRRSATSRNCATGRSSSRAAAKFRAAGKLLAVYKVGASEKGAEATRSHTAALAGDSAAYDAAFARAGVARAGELVGLADLAYLHTLGDKIGGSNCAILSISGAAGAILSDALALGGRRCADACRHDVQAGLSAQIPAIRWSRTRST